LLEAWRKAYTRATFNGPTEAFLTVATKKPGCAYVNRVDPDTDLKDTREFVTALATLAIDPTTINTTPSNPCPNPLTTLVIRSAPTLGVPAPVR
jgi:hypothetical protein